MEKFKDDILLLKKSQIRCVYTALLAMDRGRRLREVKNREVLGVPAPVDGYDGHRHQSETWQTWQYCDWALALDLYIMW